MTNAVSVSSIRDVRLGSSGTFVIAGTDHSGIPIDMIFRSADVQNIAAPILCCAAAEAGGFGPREPAGLIVPGCQLPIMNWQVGRSNINGEAVLILTVAGGSALMFQFPAQSAQLCGKALADEGMKAAPDIGAKPN